MAGRKQTQVILTIFLLNLLYLAISCKPERNTTDLFYYQTDSLQQGDIILRKSYGLISDIVAAQLNDSVDVSHCGIITADAQGEWMVIHTLSEMVSDYDGMQQCSLQEFMADSRIETVKVYRYKHDKNTLIADYARYYLEKHIPFDEKFDPTDSTAFFCSEMPLHIIKTVFGNDISNGAQKPKFSVFIQPALFSEVPFVYINTSVIRQNKDSD